MTTSPSPPKNAARHKRSATPRLSREDWIYAALEALQRGEINDNGVINERLFDQVRRREINFHGIEWPEGDYLEDRV